MDRKSSVVQANRLRSITGKFVNTVGPMDDALCIADSIMVTPNQHDRNFLTYQSF